MVYWHGHLKSSMTWYTNTFRFGELCYPRCCGLCRLVSRRFPPLTSQIRTSHQNGAVKLKMLIEKAGFAIASSPAQTHSCCGNETKASGNLKNPVSSWEVILVASYCWIYQLSGARCVRIHAHGMPTGRSIQGLKPVAANALTKRPLLCLSSLSGKWGTSPIVPHNLYSSKRACKASAEFVLVLPSKPRRPTRTTPWTPWGACHFHLSIQGVLSMFCFSQEPDHCWGPRALT